MTRRVTVTNHALARWRQRVAGYADATADEVVAAVLAARRVPADWPLPFPRLVGHRYYRDAGRPGLFFVCDARDAHLGREVVVTCMFAEGW